MKNIIIAGLILSIILLLIGGYAKHRKRKQNQKIKAAILTTKCEVYIKNYMEQQYTGIDDISDTLFKLLNGAIDISGTLGYQTKEVADAKLLAIIKKILIDGSWISEEQFSKAAQELEDMHNNSKYILTLANVKSYLVAHITQNPLKNEKPSLYMAWLANIAKTHFSKAGFDDVPFDRLYSLAASEVVNKNIFTKQQAEDYRSKAHSMFTRSISL